MPKVWVTTTIRESIISVEVDANELAKNLTQRATIVKNLGYRIGEPLDLTQTFSDPISHEKAETYHTMLMAKFGGARVKRLPRN